MLSGLSETLPDTGVSVPWRPRHPGGPEPMTEPMTDPIAEHRIVDADCHILEPPDIWDNWLPERHREKAPKLVKDAQGGDAWLTGVGGDPDPIGLTATPGMPFDEFRWFGVTYEEARAGCYNGAARLADMDVDGVWAEVLFPPQRTMSHFLGDEDDDFVLAGVEAYNNFLFEEFCAPDPSRLIGLAQIPSLGIDVAVDGLRKAKARGAKIYAELAGYGVSSDAQHITEPDPTGVHPARAMQMALADGGIDASEVDYVNAHGTSTPLGDASETRVLKKALGEDNAHKTAVSSTKGATGHCLGAAGAVEAIFSVLAIKDGVLPPTINYEYPDPECDLDYIPNEARPSDVRVAMSNSFGFGGHNASIVLKRYED